MKMDYDVIVIGGGSGGLTAAKFAKGVGKKVAIVEKNKLGGECTWTGCVPSKTIIKSAQIARQTQHLKKYGLHSKGPIEIDTSNVMQHMRVVVQEIYATHTPEKLEEAGVEVLFGEARFVDQYTIRLNDREVRAKQFIISTGSSPFVPPIDGLEDVSYYTNQTFFALQELPKSLIILGGGAIGAELSCALHGLGVAVTIIEMQDRILAKEDTDVAVMLAEHMKKEGINIQAGMKAVHVSQLGDEIAVLCEDESGNKETFSAQTLLVAVGRKPNVELLDLNAAGVQTHKKGIVVDDYLRTTAKNIFACGDVVGPYQFSHMAFYQAVTATRNALIPIFKKKVRYDNAIWVTFADPELARIGLTESEARKKYKNINVYTRSYDMLDRAHNDRATTGMLKVICDKKGYILGAHMLGARAGDAIHELYLAKERGIKFTDLQSIIHAYPTYSELIWHTAKKAYVEELKNNFWVRLLRKIMGK